MSLPKLLTAAEFGEKWGRSTSTILQWCRSGKLGSDAQFVGNRMWVIKASAAPRTRFFDPEDLKLLNELSDVDPTTGKPKREYPAPPRGQRGRKGYAVPNLRGLRIGSCLTQEELAKLSGVSRQAIIRAEKGKGIVAANVRALADALEVGVGELMREEEHD